MGDGTTGVHNGWGAKSLVDNLIGRYDGALVEIDEAAGRATGIERVDRGLE